MGWLCERCELDFDSPATDPDTGDWSCPTCGTPIRLASARVEPPRPQSDDPAATAAIQNAATPPAEPSEEAPADTVFQPVLMMESIMDELDSEAPRTSSRSAVEPDTEALESHRRLPPPPLLQLDLEAYLLVLGADPGQERHPLVRARTTFGRKNADVVLRDPAASSCHFQIEAFGREFFVRDLDSRNGTFLNGSRVRYSQLLPGDQISAGKTTLIFRTSDDPFDRVPDCA